METYIFHREINGKPMFYPVDLLDDADAIANAHANPGTTKVERTDGSIVYTPESPLA